jgi:hypothetical protein
MSRALLEATWAEHVRLDRLWLAAIAVAKSSIAGPVATHKRDLDAEVEAHREATRAWVAARAIGTRPGEKR